MVVVVVGGGGAGWEGVEGGGQVERQARSNL